MKISKKNMIIVMALVKHQGECPYKRDRELVLHSRG